MKKNHKSRTYSITVEATESRHKLVETILGGTSMALGNHRFPGISFVSHLVIKQAVKDEQN